LRSVHRAGPPVHQRHALLERDTVLREIHHRVKNNLQLVSSLLSLSTHGAPPDFAAVVRDCQLRIRAMALFHDRILSGSFARRVDMAAYLTPLVEDAVRCFPAAPRIEVVTRLEPLCFEGLAAVTCGFIVNELVVNSAKHAFPDERRGRIVVGLSRTVQGRDPGVVLDVRDNGIGLPPATGRRPGLGLELVRNLAAQLSGRVAERRTRGAWHRVLLPGTLAG
jgi:two-component sensor histidine kinase